MIIDLNCLKINFCNSMVEMVGVFLHLTLFRLITVVHLSDVFIMLQDVCCITPGGDFFMPSKEAIMDKRLVVSTLITAGR